VLDALLEEARQDENVIGVVVHGSRARGLYLHEGSDWDVVVVVREPTGRYDSERGGRLEAFEVSSLEDLPKWMLPAVTWTMPALDKTGAVTAQLAEITTIDPATAAEPLDGYVNSYYRSA
jgi:predicted nucleotidyltransferase